MKACPSLPLSVVKMISILCYVGSLRWGAGGENREDSQEDPTVVQIPESYTKLILPAGVCPQNHQPRPRAPEIFMVRVGREGWLFEAI